MKMQRVVRLAAAALLLHSAQAASQAQHSVRYGAVDFGETKQPIDGFGTSLCWWAVGVGGWSNTTAFDALMDLYFKPGVGLGLNQVRYNIGGSDKAAGDAHFLRAGGFVQTYAPSKGKWDWTADATQRRVVTAAKQRGVEYVQAFSNSPPYWMTVSGSVSGNKDGDKDNLQAENFEAFADYLAAVASHFHTDWNVTFDSVTPLNEPISSWWKYGNQQEGCHFSDPSESRIVGLTAEALRAHALPAALGVSGPEENSIDDAVKSVQAYKAADLAALSLITTHTYGGSERKALSRFASAHGKRLWASEYGDGDVSGLTLAARITLDLNELNCSVWTLWQVADLDNSLNTHGGWGLTAATYCGCTGGQSCVCSDTDCGGKRDTWDPSWSKDPHAACEEWSTNKDWGALKDGATLAQSCRMAFGKESCARTCCEASSGPDGSALTPHADGSAGAFAIRKSFYAYKQFTAFVRPGSKIVMPPKPPWTLPSGSAAAEPSVLAAVTPEGQGVLIYTNQHNSSSVGISHPLAGLAALMGTGPLCATPYRTDATHNCEQLPRLALGAADDATLTLETVLPPASISTFVLASCEVK